MYKKLYYFTSLDVMKQGKIVYFCDKKAQKVWCLNHASMSEYLVLMQECEKDESRFDFWIEIEEEEK